MGLNEPTSGDRPFTSADASAGVIIHPKDRALGAPFALNPKGGTLVRIDAVPGAGNIEIHDTDDSAAIGAGTLKMTIPNAVINLNKIVNVRLTRGIAIKAAAAGRVNVTWHT